MYLFCSTVTNISYGAQFLIFRDLCLMLNEMYVMEFYLADPRDDLSGMDVARKV